MLQRTQMEHPVATNSASMAQLIYRSPTNWEQLHQRILSHPHEMRLSHLQDILSSESYPVPVDVVLSFLTPDVGHLDIGPFDQRLLLEAALVNPNTSIDVVILLLNTFQLSLADLQRIVRINMSSIPTGLWKQLILHSPSLLDKEDEYGNILLHYICEACLEHVILIILRMSKTSCKGKGLSFGGLMVKNMSGRAPLDFVVTSLRQQDSLRPWSCLEICLNEFGDLPLLHSAIKEELHSKLIEELIDHFNLNLTKVDELQRTPLILAVEKAKACELESRFVQDRFAPNKLFAILCKSKQDCRVYSHTHDKDGRLPLHIAAHMGLTWSKGLKEIFISNRSAVIDVDGKTGLLPPMLAAIGNGDLETIFEILRENPSSMKRNTTSIRTANKSFFDLEPLATLLHGWRVCSSMNT